MSGGGGGEPAAEEGGSSSSVFGENIFGEQVQMGTELNLTALMDILSNLLFFMLASFGASILMMINTTVPVQSSDKSDVASTKKAVTMLIRVKKDGLDIAATGQAQTPEELGSLRRAIGLKGEEPDFPALTEFLLEVKQKYPDSDTIIITPDPGVPYGVMIKTMDAAREKAVLVGGVSRPVKLFPTTVVSTMVH